MIASGQAGGGQTGRIELTAGCTRAIRHGALLLAAIFGACPSALAAAEPPAMPAITYPDTRRGAVVDTLFGETIADPYRWLENDVRSDPEVADWVTRQNAVTQDYLATLPARDWFAARIRALTDYERFGLPRKAGHRYFYLRNSGLQNQSTLEVRDRLAGKPRRLLDPNSWAQDGTAALDPELCEPSHDGTLLAYGVQQSGSDWRVLHVLDVATGRQLPDELQWVNQSRIAWVGHRGFFYSRFPAPPPGQLYQALNFNQTLWFHRIGTLQSADELVYATPDHPDWGHTAQVTSDGRYALITSATGTDARYELHLIDLAAHRGDSWKVRPLITGFEHDWRLVDSIGHSLWFVTNWDAPRYRLMVVDLAAPEPRWREIVRQGEEPLQQADKAIAENADELAFLAKWTGLEVK